MTIWREGRAVTLLAGLGVVWSAYGVVQFVGSLTASPDALMTAGLTAAQAAVMTSYPAWMSAAFGIGVFGGLVGSALLALRHGAARPVLAASLAAYGTLFIGDVTEGVFAVMGAPQVAVLSLVLAIAAGLFWLSGRVGRTRPALAAA
jgi:hypothetical protein